MKYLIWMTQNKINLHIFPNLSSYICLDRPPSLLNVQAISPTSIFLGNESSL